MAWDGQFVGIVAHLKSDRARRLATIGTPAIPELVAALSDWSKTASAHAVLLTMISRVERETVPYNGLRVTFTADGRTLFDPDDAAPWPGAGERGTPRHPDRRDSPLIRANKRDNGPDVISLPAR